MQPNKSKKPSLKFKRDNPVQTEERERQINQYIRSLGPEKLRVERLKAESDLESFYKPRGRTTKVFTSESTLKSLPQNETFEQLNEDYASLGIAPMEASDIVLQHNADKPKIIWLIHGAETSVEPFTYNHFPFESLVFYTQPHCALVGVGTHIPPSAACDGTLGNAVQYTPNERKQIELVPMVFKVSSKDVSLQTGVYICMPGAEPKIVKIRDYNWFRMMLGKKVEKMIELNEQIQMQNEEPGAVQQPLFQIANAGFNHPEIWQLSQYALDAYNKATRIVHNISEFQLCLISCRSTMSSVQGVPAPTHPLTFEKPHPYVPNKMMNYLPMSFSKEPVPYSYGGDKKKNNKTNNKPRNRPSTRRKKRKNSYKRKTSKKIPF